MTKTIQNRVAIIGTVGVPGNYGGFETLAENLVHYHGKSGRQDRLTVYCSANAYENRPKHFGSADLLYIPLWANGIQSILYDIVSLLWTLRRRETHLFILGVSGCIALPLLRLLSSVRIYTNIDGIEWRREKWKGLAKRFLRMSERFAVRYSDVVIADNAAIAGYVLQSYGRECSVIAYGGDHARATPADLSARDSLPDSYALALCRIEPENNVAMILNAWTQISTPLVFVGNWSRSQYGRALKLRYSHYPNITLLDPIYDPAELRAIRDGATLYVHGHSAGGTNPSLVEMMHFGIPIIAHGCDFNRETTENAARYFMEPRELRIEVAMLDTKTCTMVGTAMKDIANRRYRWEAIGQSYFSLIDNR